MALLGELLQSGLEEAGEDIAKKAFSKGAKKTTKEVGESTLAKIGKKIPVSMTSDFPSDFARVPVKFGKNTTSNIADEAAKLGLTKNSAGKWVMDTGKWATDEDIDALKGFMKPILGEDTPSYSRFLEQIGEGDYQMSHRPGYINDEIGDMEYAPLNNIEGSGTIFPKAYGANKDETINNLIRGYGGTSDEHRRAAKIIADYQGQPDKMVTIYRQSPKDFNYGDWVALTPDYANMHEGNSELNKLFTKEVPASEVVFAGDDINEWGWFPKEIELDDALGAEVDKTISGAKSAGYLGEPMHLYHQTSASSLGDMAIDKRKAIGADYGMPEGIFLKETPEDIGLPGKNQLALDATMENPITFEDRQALAKYIGDKSPAYKSLMDELDKINNDYEEYVFDYMADRGMNPDDYIDFDTAMNEVDKYVEGKAKDAREMVRNQLVNEGYDGAIVNVDEGTKGRKVKSYIVFDKNQLKPRYSDKIKFNPEDATSIYSYAKGKQAEMKSMLDGVAQELDLSGKKYSVVADKNKSIDSMVKKVNRKQASGRDYRLMDMKDHVRGAFMVNDLTDKDAIGEVMDAIQREVGVPVSVENVKSEMGYNGIHLTWRDEDGLGYEVQITNPEVWKTKKASDRIYHKWRNVTPAELDADPKKMMQYLNDERESKNLWGDLWRKLGFNNNAPDFSWAENWLEDMGDMGF